MEDLTSEIKALAKREGVNLVGIASTKDWKAVKGHKPTDVFPKAKSVIVLIVRTPDPVIETGNVKDREDAAVEAERMIGEVGAKISSILVKKGYLGIPIKSNAFPLNSTPIPYRTAEYFSALEKQPFHKDHLRGQLSLVYAAFKAGLGVVGKSGLLLTPQYGPRIHIGAIISNASLEPDKPLNMDFCSKCLICEKVCIGESIKKGHRNPERCWRTEWEKGEPIPGLPFKVCPAPCLRNCPVGKLKERCRSLS
jgi:epoxyqueuosine reductase